MRQQYVLRRMLELGFISEAEHRQAIDTPLKVVTSGTDFGGSADYVAEMARQIAYEQFQEEAYTRGIKVITTITKAEQEAAYRALRRGIMDYDRRHGYRGAEAYVDPARMKAEGEAMDEILAETPDYDDMLAAIVTEVRRRGHRLPLRRDDPHQRRRPALCRPHGGRQGPPNKRIRAGAIVRITRNDNGRWEITQLPEVEGALASADPRTGAIRALAGGFDFSRNKFNHVTQAWRQPGSSFKPFIYSAAFEKGYGPNSVVDDSPLSFSSARPAARPGSPRTTTAATTARSRCARPWPAPRTWCRSACSSRSARATPRTTSPSSASTPSATRPTSRWPSAPAR
jgi:penicillin-binding protein 1A